MGNYVCTTPAAGGAGDEGEARQNQMKQINKDYPVMKIVLLGLEGSGKTTLINKILGHVPGKFAPGINDNKQFAPTTGSHLYQMVNNSMMFGIWDIGGMPVIVRNWKLYLEATRVVVYAIDSTKDVHVLANKDDKSFQDMLSAAEKACRSQITTASIATQMTHTNALVNKKPFILVILTKRDPNSSMSIGIDKILSYVRIDQHCKSRGFEFKILEVSVKNPKSLEVLKNTLHRCCLNSLKSTGELQKSYLSKNVANDYNQNNNPPPQVYK
ncbi:MAG: hypothetical protein MHMPM18_001220 [Marteilia pararefringens]